MSGGMEATAKMFGTDTKFRKLKCLRCKLIIQTAKFFNGECPICKREENLSVKMKEIDDGKLNESYSTSPPNPKAFEANRPPCPNCQQPLSDSEMSLQQSNGPIPLCFKCYEKISAKATDAHSKQRAFKEHGHDTINHPTYYNVHPSGIECIEITRHMNFNLGNAIKYIWRANEKGDSIENLRKAIWYLNDEIVRLTKKDNQ